ncbi:hypothetical protein ACWKSP_26840 [Micromonosporaceae bacterium Da 78-11]
MSERTERETVAQRTDEVVEGGLAGVPRQGYAFADEIDDRPLPDLPPLPADPRWRVAHLPFLSAVSMALLLCAASVGFFVGGSASAFGAAVGVLIVTISFTMSTLVIAWADTVRPALLMPLALLTYVLKYSILGLVLAYGVASDWTGKAALGWGIVAGVVVWTAVQAWWFTRLARPK